MHDIARAAAEAAQVPHFGELQRRGNRRRKVRTGVAVGVAALTVASVIGIGQAIGPDGGREIEPAPSPTPSREDRVEGWPESLPVDDRDAFLTDAAVLDDGAVAGVWTVGDRDLTGLAVIYSQGSAPERSTHNYDIPQEVFAAGDRLLVRDESMTRLQVVTPSGTVDDVVVEGDESPVGDGEIPVAMSDGLVAVDPAAATAHPVPSPDDVFDIEVYGGRLSATSRVVSGGAIDEVTYHWSDDGGANWDSATFETAWDDQELIVPTEAGTEHALAIATNDEAIRPLGSVLTLPADGGAFTETPYDGELATFAGAWTVDGEVRFLGDLWGGPQGRLRESGVYRWVDGRLDLIASSAPEVTDGDNSTLVDVVDAEGGPTLLIAVDDRLFRSPDGGVTWTEIAAR